MMEGGTKRKKNKVKVIINFSNLLVPLLLDTAIGVALLLSLRVLEAALHLIPATLDSVQT